MLELGNHFNRKSVLFSSILSHLVEEILIFRLGVIFKTSRGVTGELPDEDNASFYRNKKLVKWWDGNGSDISFDFDLAHWLPIISIDYFDDGNIRVFIFS